jgi:hypothetical protein
MVSMRPKHGFPNFHVDNGRRPPGAVADERGLIQVRCMDPAADAIGARMNLQTLARPDADGGRLGRLAPHAMEPARSLRRRTRPATTPGGCP